MSVATLAVRVTGESSSFDKVVARVEKTTNGLADTVEAMSARFDKAGGAFSGLASQATAVAAGMLTAQAAIAGVGAVANGAISAVKTLGGSFVDAVKHTADLGDTLFGLSQKTGVSVESLSALRFAAGQTNTSLETITSAVFKMQTSLGKGGESVTNAVTRLGLSLHDLRTADPSDAFARIVSKLGEIPNATQRATLGAEIFGRQFKEIAQLTQENLGDLVQKAHDLGAVMSTETAVAADRFGDVLGELSAQTEGFALKIGGAALPGLITFAETFQKSWSIAATSAANSGMQIGAAVDALAVAIGEGVALAIKEIALLVDAFTEFATGKFFEGAAVFQLFTQLQTQALVTGRVIDTVFAGGALKGALDELESLIGRQITFVAQTASVVGGASAQIRQLARTAADAAAGVAGSFASTFDRVKGEIAASANDMRKHLRQVGDGAEEGADKASAAFKRLADRIKGVDVIETARDWAKALKDPEAVAHVFASRTLSTELRDALDAVVIKFGDLETAGLGAMEKIADAVRRRLTPAVREGLEGLARLPGQLVSTFDAILRPQVLEGPLGRLPGTVVPVPTADELGVATVGPFRQAFENFAQELPGILISSLQNGNNVFVAAAGGLATQFSRVFDAALQRIFKQGGSLTPGERAAGLLGVGLQSFVNGVAVGQQTTSLTQGALTGLLTGGLAGANPALSGPTLGASIVIGAGAGLVGGLVGAASGRRQERFAVQQAKDSFVAQFGGIEKLRALAEKAGLALDSVFDATRPEEFQRAVADVNNRLAIYNRHLEGLQTALAGVNRRAEVFANQFRDLVNRRTELTNNGVSQDSPEIAALTAKLSEVAQRTQPEFERLGLMVRDTFSGLVRESGDAFSAIVALAPSFQVLQDGVKEFGLTSTAVIDELLKSFSLINDDTFGPLLQNVQSSGQVLKGLFDAKALSPEGFQSIAADIGQSLQELANKGGDLPRALALSQPVLQTLWEAQLRFGAITDDTTLRILGQAQAQGLVGEHMRDVNEKILDVLIAIADVFGAQIPDALRGLPSAAQTAAQGVEDAFTGINPRVNVLLDIEEWRHRIDIDDDGHTLDVPRFGAGGIVTRPTLAIVGEKGPEAIVPLGGAALGLRAPRASGNDDAPTVHITIDNRGSYILDSEAAADRLTDRMIPSLQRALGRDQRGIRTTVENITS